MNTEIYDTTGMDATTLQQAALLLSQSLGEGHQVEVKGPQAAQLATLAGMKMGANFSDTSQNSIYQQYLANFLTSPALATGIVGAPIAAAQAAAETATAAPTATTKWIAGIAGNWLLIGIGVALALGALLISQRKPIGKIVDTSKKVAGKVAEVAAFAA